jgi:hypothetical protein
MYQTKVATLCKAPKQQRTNNEYSGDRAILSPSIGTSANIMPVDEYLIKNTGLAKSVVRDTPWQRKKCKGF